MNPNTLWAEVFVDELIRAGVQAVVLAPGSRSTPLTAAFAARDDLRRFSLLDERSAAFFALGWALETGHPAAVVTTSGTAATECFPAVAEAERAGVPLLLLTADRPHELRDSGANQTMDQVKLYGERVRWFVDVPPPEADPPDRVLRALRVLADRAVAVAQGFGGPPGPVHLNFPFRKPLEPSPDAAGAAARLARPAGQPFTRLQAAPSVAAPDTVHELLALLRDARRGLIVAGPRCPGGDFPAALAALSRALGFPILADPLSGLRFGPHIARTPVLGGYETFLTAGLPTSPPQVVLRFGAMPTSKALGEALEALPPDTVQVGVTAHARWQDPTFTLHRLIHAEPTTLCRALTAALPPRTPDADWLAAWQAAEAAAWDAVRQVSPPEGRVLAEVVAALPDGARLVVANSNPVRHLDQFVPPQTKALRVFANRGVSGIDGTVSTALGVAAAGGQPTVLVTGDLSLYHDLNGLLALRRCDVRAHIVLIHNDGGGIFHRLPIAQHDPPFTEWFVTPHGLDFAPAAQMYGLRYRRVAVDTVGAALRQALAAARPSLTEVRTDAGEQEAARRQVLATYQHGTRLQTEDAG